MEGLKDRLEAAEEQIRLFHRVLFGNGNPGLEQRMMKEVNEMFETEREARLAQHEENTKKFDRLTWIAGIGAGIVITLQCLILSNTLKLR